ncbi:MAG: hypothetical protein KKE76_13270 [Gammaproteobacteria bacterium]|jgi:t-SNARE complex subunit (syntaxin)|nr:hypothetical protein [Gammaproteobacteria bacterium]
MDPYLVEVARNIDSLNDRDSINDAMDKLEFLYEAVDEQQQDLLSDLMQRLQTKLDNLN